MWCCFPLKKGNERSTVLSCFWRAEQMSCALRFGCWHCPGSSPCLCWVFPAHSEVHWGVGVLAGLLALSLADGC